MAETDAERYPRVAAGLGIKKFPTLVLFVNGTPIPYTGGLSSEEIVIWVRKKTGTPVVRINSVMAAEEFLKKHSTFAVGLFEKPEGSDYEEFIKAATADNEIQFVQTSRKDVAKVLYPVMEPTDLFFGLVKGEPEQYTPFQDDFHLDKILQFLEDNKFPLVTRMTERNSAKLYSSTNKMQVYIFAKTNEFKKLLKPLQEIARKFKSKIMIVYVDIREENLAKPSLTLFGLEQAEDTIVTSFDYNSSFKYLLEAEATPKNIEEFCQGLVHRTLSPYYKSQPIPDNKNARILTVVGKTFDDVVLNSPNNVLLEVHTPWCITCETTSKQMEKLAKHFKGLENLIFARIDASVNEHPKLQVDDYPTLLFYPANDKLNPVKFPTKSSVEELVALINTNCHRDEEVYS